ncbi:MAG: hypothetical protein ABIO29_00220 [Sphingomicrobium sp.]
MASPSYRIPKAYEEVPLRRRVSGLGLTLALNLLVIFLLIGLTGRRPDSAPPQRGITVVGVEPAPPESKPEEQRQAQLLKQARPRLVKPKIVLPVKPTITPPPTLDILELSKEELKSTDEALAKPSTASSEGGNGGGSDTPVVGRGPNGQALYAAEWVREPTDQELDFYLNGKAQPGYGIIACKTIAGFRVDDCVAIESKPVSSKLARALLAAAWQFRVRPPRKDGQLMVGEWVTIRITYSVSAR